MDQILIELKALKSLFKTLVILRKEVLTLDEACWYSGISKSHMYKLTSGRRIPCYKPSIKMIRFKREELNDWLLQNRNTTEEELEKTAENWIIKNGRAKK